MKTSYGGFCSILARLVQIFYIAYQVNKLVNFEENRMSQQKEVFAPNTTLGRLNWFPYFFLANVTAGVPIF